jgi:hypothetical protein
MRVSTFAAMMSTSVYGLICGKINIVVPKWQQGGAKMVPVVSAIHSRKLALSGVLAMQDF